MQIFFYISFYISAALLIYLSYRSFRGGLAYLAYFKDEISKPASGYAPFASIIVPCKGLDEGLAENLSALLSQDYPNYEIIFVVDDKEDRAVAVIEKLRLRYVALPAEKMASPPQKQKCAKSPQNIKLIVAPRATRSSQKVENLREAVLHAGRFSRVFVFVDSDARPGDEWLRQLIAPLKEPNIGAATGYRWFIAEKTGLATEMRSAWNASIASALGPNRKTNFCWGGSTAIRREVFENLRIREKWHGTLSDDFTLTRAVREAGLFIHFVPKALTASVGNCTFSELIEFTTRQIKITRVYAPALWKLSFFGSGLFNAVMASAAAILIFGGRSGITAAAAIFTILSVSIPSIGKSWLRLQAVRLALPEYDRKLRQQAFAQLTLWLFAPALFFYSCLVASFSRQMTWRGVKYEMISAETTQIISSSEASEAKEANAKYKASI